MEKMDRLIRHDRAMNRRSFLKLSGLLGVGVATAGIVTMKSEAVRFDRKMMKVSESKLGIGTFVSITVIHPSKDQAEEAIGQAFHEIDRLCGLLNRFDEATPVALLNKEGYLKDIPKEVVRVVSASLYYHRVTGGSFDITVKPVVDLFIEKLGGEKKTILMENEMKKLLKEIEKLLKLIGSENIELKERSIHFKRPGMGITLDGIAKGFIVDRASEILSKHKIENYLINAGGEINTKGAKGDHRLWTVAIQDPLKKKHYPDVIRMRDGSIATSGDYEVYFDQEKMFSHIVDPKTGLSPHLSTSVSIIADTGMEADALSTGVFVMGPLKGARFIDALPGCECLIVARDGTVTKSKGWKSAAI